MRYLMVGFLASALSMTPEQKVNIRLCAASRQTILLRHNGKLKSVKAICDKVINDPEVIQDEDLFEECWEFMSFCKE